VVAPNKAVLAKINHAITIRRSPHDVWPWLAQMGAGRAGWYGYDFIDNGGQRTWNRFWTDDGLSLTRHLPTLSDHAS